MSYKQAKGDGPNTGVPKSPPTRVIPPAPNAVSDLRHPIGPGGLGQNNFSGPSSSELDKQPVSGLASNILATNADATLSSLVKGGVKALDSGANWQTRDLHNAADKNRSAAPVHPAMAAPSGSPSGKVPPTTGYREGQPVRKPGQ